MNLQDLSKKLREAREKATSADWEAGAGNEVTVSFLPEMRRKICEFSLGYLDPKGPYDCDFVVLAANNIIPLLNELDRLIEVEKVIKEALSNMSCDEIKSHIGLITETRHSDMCRKCEALKRADEIGRSK